MKEQAIFKLYQKYPDLDCKIKKDNFSQFSVFVLKILNLNVIVAKMKI